MKKQKIGIYGGTFSPPHIGHVRAAESFADAIKLDKLLIMPDFLPPHKDIDGMVTEEDRIRMCELSFLHIRNCEISELEIKRGGKSYTAVTLQALAAPERELYFLCGTDMFLTLDTWYCPEKIFELATICCVRREDDCETEKLISRKTQYYSDKYGARIIPISADAIEISSSDIRIALKTRSRTEEYVPEAVYGYIIKKGLYQ